MNRAAAEILRGNTIVRSMGVARATGAAAATTGDQPIDFNQVFGAKVRALPDVVSRLKAYLRKTGSDPRFVDAINQITHGPEGDWDLVLTDFTYSPINQQFAPTVVAQSVFTNPTEAEITQDFSYSKTVTDSFRFQFSESLGIGVSVSVSAGLPIIGEGDVSVSSEFTFGAEQEWTSTDSRTWSAAFSIKVPPQQKIRATASLSMAKFSASFACQAKAGNGGSLLVGTGSAGTTACVDVVVPVAAFFPDPAERPSVPIYGVLTGTEGVSSMVTTENI